MTKIIMNRHHLATLLATAVLAAFLAGGLGAVLAPAGALAALPDGRAYEMVSPADKNGGDVMASASRTRASVAGDAINFASLTGFADIAGSGVAAEYISRRDGKPGTSGWSTHSITPFVNPTSVLAVSQSKDTLYQVFSPDLSKGVLHTYTPLTDAPNVANASNLYLRDDTLTPGRGSYRLLSDAVEPVGDFRPFVADATPELDHVLFEATEPLTPGGPQPSGFLCLLVGVNCPVGLYESDNGVVRLAGVLPDGSPAPLSTAGGGAAQRRYTPNTISDDGRKIFFTVPTFSGSKSGDLYMRQDNGQPDALTAKINASERTDCADSSPCNGTPAPADPQQANYLIASDDGSMVFFTTGEQLTNEPAGGSFNLYGYDTTLPASDPHNLTLIKSDDPAASTWQAIATSSDGSYLYFLTSGGGPEQVEQFGINVWHDGTARLIGSVGDPTSLTLDGAAYNLKTLAGRVTPDGRSFLFVSSEGTGLTGFNHGEGCGNTGTGDVRCAELYLYRYADDSLACVSCSPTGETPVTNATTVVGKGTGGSEFMNYLNHPLSDDGRHVFFETGERLVAGDVNGARSDVYRFDSATGTVGLISSGTSDADSHFLDASRDGRDVFFTTAERLVGWDTDNNYDLYDARVGGGFPEPAAPAPACAGDSCQGRSSAAPGAAAALGSTSFRGSGNLQGTPRRKQVPVKCKRAFVRKKVRGKVRCVKKPSRAVKPARRAAGTHGRGQK